MRYLLNYVEAILFILIFGIGNVVNLIWKKHMNKVFWTVLAGLWIHNFYTWYQDPSGTWEIVKTNLQNPWYLISLGSLLIIIIFITVVAIKNRKVTKNAIKILEGMKKSLMKSAEETGLMNSGRIPSDEDILKYYRMYLVKFRLDNENEWTTDEPRMYENFCKEAKKTKSEFIERVGWGYLISMTSDMFSFDSSTGQSTMMRYRDYHDMINEQIEREYCEVMMNR